MRGSSEAIGLFVDLLLPIGSILWYLFLASFAYDYSILNAVILFLIGFASVMIWSVLMKDNILLSVVGSVLMLPLVVYLILMTSLFGLI